MWPDASVGLLEDAFCQTRGNGPLTRRNSRRTSIADEVLLSDPGENQP